MVTPSGLEPEKAEPKSAEESSQYIIGKRVSEIDALECAADCAKSISDDFLADPALVRVAAAWTRLPIPIRKAILAMIESV